MFRSDFIKKLFHQYETSVLHELILPFFKAYFTFEEKFQMKHKGANLSLKEDRLAVNIVSKFIFNPIKNLFQ